MSSEEGTNNTKRTQTLAKTMIPKRYRTPVSKFFLQSSERIHENWKRIWVLTFWLSVNVALFAYKFREYRENPTFQVLGYCVCMAKGAAETLKFNMALALCPVCRRTLTKLRETFLGAVIPFDDNINFHKIIALSIAIGTFLHVLFHLSCNMVRLSTCPADKFIIIYGRDFNYHQPTYFDLIVSVPGTTGIMMVFVMSFSFTLALHSFRRNVVKLPWPLNNLAGFNSFWYAHHLLAIVYFLLILHGYYLLFAKEWYGKTVSKVTALSNQICNHTC